MQHRREAAAAGMVRRVGGGTTWLTAASLVSGVASYAFQVVASRGLGEEGFAPIGVLWTIQYLLVAVPLFSIETYLVRTVAGRGGRFPRAKLPHIGAAVAAVAALVACGSWWARDRLFAGQSDLALVAGLLAVAYGLYIVARGTLAGRRRYGPYGTTTLIEAGARLALVFPVLALWSTTRAVAWLMPVGAALAAAWGGTRILLGAEQAGRAAAPAATTGPRSYEAADAPVGRYLAITLLTSGSSQALLAGGPLVLVALGADASAISVFFVTITAARIPLVLAYGGLLSRLTPTLGEIQRRGSPRGKKRVYNLTAVLTVLTAAAATGLGAIAGPPLIAWFFGSDFVPAPWLAGGAAGGVTVACGAMFLNQFMLAGDEEGRTLAPWLAALLVAGVALVVVDGGPVAKVTVAFVSGELAAFAALWLCRGGRRQLADPDHLTDNAS